MTRRRANGEAATATNQGQGSARPATGAAQLGDCMTRKKVAILGGGIGAIYAAYQLTSFPDWQSRFDVTLYQMGWRLGGKCASGRNARFGQRIEEHGLHIWSGFYDNAIRLMKDCYAEAQPLGGVFPSFEAAFKPFNNIVLAEQVNGGWVPWQLQPPGNPAVCGEGELLLTPWDYLCEGLGWLKAFFEQMAPLRPLLQHRAAAELPQHVRRAVGAAAPAAGPDTHLHQLQRLAGGLPRQAHRHGAAAHGALLWLLEAAAAELRQAFALLDGADDLGRRLFYVLDLGLACIRGAIADRIIFEGFDVIDGYEISEWLERHGAHAQSLESACARGIYDYAFGFSRGVAEPGHRAIAAGTSLRGVCRLMFTYKGAYFYKMQGGMGDTVFTPMYKVLKQRGVKFRFFHKVTALQADAADRTITQVRMTRQADLKNGEYQPLVRVKGLDCWPSEPDYAQLRQGEELRRREVDLESSWSDWPGAGELTLQRGRDFDQVILGIPVGALTQICGDLASKDLRWRDMLQNIKTTRTQACQLWFKRDSAALGWKFDQSILTCYQEDFDTWADMSQLLPAEDWPEKREPGSVAYFCGPMADDADEPQAPDPAYPQSQYRKVQDQARQWLEQNAAWLWPEMFKSGAVDWNVLESGTRASGARLFEQQYFRANIDPAERYVLSVPGSTRYRLKSDQSGFDNLYLAGDWTYNGINAGCVEAAALSGRRAAAGLAGERLTLPGEKDLIPEQDRGRPAQRLGREAPNLPWPWHMVYGLLQTSGANAMLGFPDEVVRAMLPAGLELDRQFLTPPGQHPVVLYFGWQDQVRVNFWPRGWDYLEFIISIPYVRHADLGLRTAVPGPFIYMPRLFLNKRAPVLLGVWAYGYNKALAEMSADDRHYAVRAQDGSPIVSCSFERARATGSCVDFPRMRAIQQAYALPLVSRTRWGQWLYSYFDFALGQALIQPIDMSIEIHDPAATGLPAGRHAVPSVVGSDLGGFFMSTAASISNPLQSRVLGRRIRQLAGNPRPPLLPFS